MDSGVLAVEDPVSGRRIWSRPFQLGWLYTTLEEKPMTVAEICHMRYMQKEKVKTEVDWRVAVPNCPCSQKQAENDFRFAREDPLLAFGDSTRCFTSYPIRGSTGASQCCYRVDSAGLLVYSNDSASPTAIDSTMMRAHYLGGYPFNRFGRVPIFSFLSTDAMLKHTCCEWSHKISPASCSYYKEVRATKDCSSYRTPFMAAAYGLGHFKTFRGTFYQFYGKGDYVLMKGDGRDVENIQIQGRFEQVTDLRTGEPANATGLTAIGAKISCKYGTSKAYVEHRKSDPPGVFLYIDGVKQEHIDIRFRDIKVKKNVVESSCITAVYSVDETSESVGLLLSDGAVVRVTAVHQVLNIQVQMPDISAKVEAMPAYLGLFGELSFEKREPGADLFDLDNNRIVEPSEIQDPKRIQHLATKTLVSDHYSSVMLWFEGMSVGPQDYADPTFKPTVRYHHTVSTVEPVSTTTTISTSESTPVVENKTNETSPDPVPASPVVVVHDHDHPAEDTNDTNVEPVVEADATGTKAVEVTSMKPHSENDTHIHESVTEAPIVRRRRRREAFSGSFLETVDEFDFRLTGDDRLRATTKQADEFATEYQKELVDKQESFCPYLEIANGKKSSLSNRVGTQVKITGCNEGFRITGNSDTTYTCEKTTAGKAAWVPEPQAHCSVVTTTGEVAQQGMSTIAIVLIVLGGILLVGLIVVAVMILKSKSSGKAKTSDATEKYGVMPHPEESAPLNQVAVPAENRSRPPSVLPAMSSPVSPITTSTSGPNAPPEDNYMSPVTLQPPIAFPGSPTRTSAPVIGQDEV